MELSSRLGWGVWGGCGGGGVGGGGVGVGGGGVGLWFVGVVGLILGGLGRKYLRRKKGKEKGRPICSSK